jgi:hypothetical protein
MFKQVYIQEILGGVGLYCMGLYCKSGTNLTCQWMGMLSER